MRSYKNGTSSQIRATSNDSTTVLKGFPVLVPPSGLPNKFKFQGSKEEDFGPGTEEEVGWRMFPIHNSVWSLVCIFFCVSLPNYYWTGYLVLLDLDWVRIIMMILFSERGREALNFYNPIISIVIFCCNVSIYCYIGY